MKWKKGLFDDIYQIYSDESSVGFLKRGTDSSYGEINGKPYLFNSVGAFKQIKIIYDAENYRKLGEIRLNDWTNGGTIILNNKLLGWKFKSFLNNELTILDTRGNDLLYLTSHGIIHTNSPEDLFILIGLVTDNIARHSRNTILFSAIFPLLILLIMWFVF
ncbi:hypothetical protein [Marivirga lumbricoides]|uniref:hypothetical protein n=1 Tax=Marivirga lumbricoides TaxID=1046115 RepID=UPI001662967C